MTSERVEEVRLGHVWTPRWVRHSFGKGSDPHMEGSGVSNPCGFEGPRAAWSVWVIFIQCQIQASLRLEMCATSPCFFGIHRFDGPTNRICRSIAQSGCSDAHQTLEKGRRTRQKRMRSHVCDVRRGEHSSEDTDLVKRGAPAPGSTPGVEREIQRKVWRSQTRSRAGPGSDQTRAEY